MSQRTPREIFLSLEGARKAYEGITATDAFELGTNYALLEYVNNLPKVGSPGSEFNSIKMEGARDLLRLLHNIHLKKDPLPPPPSPPTINYKAGS